MVEQSKNCHLSQGHQHLACALFRLSSRQHCSVPELAVVRLNLTLLASRDGKEDQQLSYCSTWGLHGKGTELRAPCCVTQPTWLMAWHNCPCPEAHNHDQSNAKATNTACMSSLATSISMICCSRDSPQDPVRGNQHDRILYH